jgi:hypothetical protein
MKWMMRRMICLLHSMATPGSRQGKASRIITVIRIEIAMDLEKLAGIKNWTTPTNVKGV